MVSLLRLGWYLISPKYSSFILNYFSFFTLHQSEINQHCLLSVPRLTSGRWTGKKSIIFKHTYLHLLSTRVQKITMGGRCTSSIMRCDWLSASRGPITLHDWRCMLSIYYDFPNSTLWYNKWWTFLVSQEGNLLALLQLCGKSMLPSFVEVG